MGSYEKIFKAYDVRGIVPDELDEDVANAHPYSGRDLHLVPRFAPVGLTE